MRNLLLVLAIGVPLIIWLLTPGFLVHYPLWIVSGNKNCAEGLSTPECVELITRLGQSGDIFGAATSLFSGLALFAVAATIFADLMARRSAAKPLIVCTIDPTKEIAFDEPNSTKPRVVRLNINLKVEAATETALNTCVSAVLNVEGETIDLEKKYVPVPLLPNRSADIQFLKRLDESGIRKIVRCVEGRRHMLLHITTTCNSIENIQWRTTVCYMLKIDGSDGIEKIRQLMGSEEEMKTAWQGGAAVAVQAELQPDSWEYEKV